MEEEELQLRRYHAPLSPPPPPVYTSAADAVFAHPAARVQNFAQQTPPPQLNPCSWVQGNTYTALTLREHPHPPNSCQRVLATAGPSRQHHPCAPAMLAHV